MSFLKSIKSLCVDTALYSLWGELQGKRQHNLYGRLLSKVQQISDKSSKGVLPIVYAKNDTMRTLSARPRVVALGHATWEEHGLWPSFKRISDFNIIPVDFVSGKWNESLKFSFGQNFLSKIDVLDKEKKVELVFIYCDSVFLDSAMLKGLTSRGILTVLMGLDDKHKFSRRVEFGMEVGQSLVAPLVDLYWTTWKSGVSLFRDIGATPMYLAEGADPNFHKPLKKDKDIDVLFMGQCYGNRKRIVHFLRSHGVQVEAYGKGWQNGFVSFEDGIELINRSKVVLGVGGVGHMSGVQHLKGRDFEVPMCGAVYLTSFNPELSDWFDIGKEVLCYSSPQNCVEVLSWLLNDTKYQNELRKAALEKSLQEHTWEQRLNYMFSVLRALG